MAFNQLLDQFIGTQQTSNAAQASTSPLAKVPGGLVGGLAAGSLLGLIAGNKKVRKTAGSLATGAAGIGGAAALGALAFKAYQNWQSNGENHPTGQIGSAEIAPETELKTDAPVRTLSPGDFEPTKQSGVDGKPFECSLVKAMIAAANADGHIDESEQKAIFEAVEKLQLEPNEKVLIFDTLRNPPGVQDICNLAGGLEQATEIYLVSRMAIDPDEPSERAYLKELSQGLSLPDELVAHLDEQIVQPDKLAA